MNIFQQAATYILAKSIDNLPIMSRTDKPNGLSTGIKIQSAILLMGVHYFDQHYVYYTYVTLINKDYYYAKTRWVLWTGEVSRVSLFGICEAARSSDQTHIKLILSSMRSARIVKNIHPFEELPE